MSPQTMPSETEIRANRRRGRCRASREDARLRERHPAARAHPRRHRARPGRAPTCSTWSSASGRPRSGSTATKTRLAPARARNRSSTACRSAETVRIVRAFSYFSHLANIAEDHNNIRQMRARSSAADRRARAQLALTLSHARAAGISRGRSAPLLRRTRWSARC